jgi:archaemetzincin
MFHRRSEREVREALGEAVEGEPRGAFVLEPHLYAPVPTPGMSDWLANHKEDGQTVAQFVGRETPNAPRGRRDVAYVLPLGHFPEASEGWPVDMAALASYAQAFFGAARAAVRVLPETPLETAGGVRSRTRGRTTQYNAKDILFWLNTDQARQLPGRDQDRELLCIAFTMEDLFPEDSWNFVFGISRPVRGVAAHSFARLSPLFEMHRREFRDTEKGQFLLRCMKIMTHEMAHLFGLKHCVFSHCLMNGVNHMDELDSSPLHLCPICLKKLWLNNKFHVASRYRDLLDFYSRFPVLLPEAEWTHAALALLL